MWNKHFHGNIGCIIIFLDLFIYFVHIFPGECWQCWWHGTYLVPVVSNALELHLSCINTLRPRQDGRHFPDDILKCIFLNENEWISLKISLKFVRKGPLNNISALVQIMAWRRPGDKPLSEPMMVSLPTHICVTRPQWVNPSIWSVHLLSSGLFQSSFYISLLPQMFAMSVRASSQTRC